MPAKRKIEDFDPNKSDSNDENYDDSVDRQPKSGKKSRGASRKSIKRRRRAGYGGSDISGDDASDSMLDDSLSESDEEPPETNEKGRPIRRSTKNAPKYDEGSSSMDELQDED